MSCEVKSNRNKGLVDDIDEFVYSLMRRRWYKTSVLIRYKNRKIERARKAILSDWGLMKSGRMTLARVHGYCSSAHVILALATTSFEGS